MLAALAGTGRRIAAVTSLALALHPVAASPGAPSSAPRGRRWLAGVTSVGFRLALGR